MQTYPHIEIPNKYFKIVICNVKSEEIIFISFPFQDGYIPDKSIYTLIYFLLHFPDHKILIHCFAGIGRTGILIGCLGITLGFTYEEITEIMLEQYRTRELQYDIDQIPQNEIQHQFLLDYENQLDEYS